MLVCLIFMDKACLNADCNSKSSEMESRQSAGSLTKEHLTFRSKPRVSGYQHSKCPCLESLLPRREVEPGCKACFYRVELLVDIFIRHKRNKLFSSHVVSQRFRNNNASLCLEIFQNAAQCSAGCCKRAVQGMNICLCSRIEQCQMKNTFLAP
jgi:hypothetical protein